MGRLKQGGNSHWRRLYAKRIQKVDGVGKGYSQSIERGNGMTYIVDFEVDGDTVSYTVKAENVIDAEEAAKEELKKDSKISGKRGSFVSSWEVKHIENIPDL